MTRYDNTHQATKIAAGTAIANGTALTSALTTNSGFNFGTVTPGTGGAITVSDDQFRSKPRIIGPRSYKFTPAAGVAGLITRTTATTSNISARIYFMLTGYTATNTQFFRLGTANLVLVLATTTGAVQNRLILQSGSALGVAYQTAQTGPTLVPFNVWCRARIAATVGGSTTTGSIWFDAIRCDTGADLGNFSAVGTADTNTAQITNTAVGKLSNSGTTPTFYTKGYAYDDASTTLIPDDQPNIAGWDMAA